MAAAIRVEDAVWRRIAEAHRHIQRPDRQILLHPVADRPAHHAAAVQVKDDGQVEPPLRHPDIADVAYPFPVRRIGGKIPIQNVGSDAKVMVAVGRDLVLAGANRLDPVNLHQPPNPALADIEAGLHQFHRHTRTAITAKAQAVLLPDMGKH